MSRGLILSPLFSDNAVLQAGRPINVFGWSAAGTLISASLDDVHRETVSPKSGKWIVTFPARGYADHAELHVNDRTTFVSRQVFIGEVYLFAGQSNIEYKMCDEAEFQFEYADFDLDNVSFYYTPQIEFEHELSLTWSDEPKPRWRSLHADNLGSVSAVAYYAARLLANAHPTCRVGVLECFKGGTSASCWISEENLAADPLLDETYLIPYHQAINNRTAADFDQADARYRSILDTYNQKKSHFARTHPNMSLEQVKFHVGHTPWPPPMRPESFLRPSGMFHTMLEKTAPYTVRSIVWYQGEGDADHAAAYERLLRRLLSEWRREFRDQEVPIYLIQLPVYSDVARGAWAEIRLAQLQAAIQLNDVRLICAVDTGEPHNIHPEHKRTIGERLGAAMLEGSATPLVQGYQVRDTMIVLNVNYARELVMREGDSVEIEVGGKWRNANITIAGTRIMIDDPGATAVRYAYRNVPVPSFFNERGWPLSPFLIDLGEAISRSS
ncbi:protein of unknown function DUF303 acetylesterase [Coriobacterium glomerans PW2]|uniref:Sialate O-acetylesterase domain-containing protein n=1 Tax=Coriobacterium glomerans (strain ATCC 49209 / DSM 20642 / JCM 10262 / PW2) TaxID=700015 RepID=F2NB41_CORGP|nr:sialate O-acetylesterase [Coriobacterium glomerans]AEB07792.1 protein of unknown function DUF303 acetylesterase [Coriobacterium glomerans PW2]